ncbi:MAG: citrate/2-methylcitrate synthase [Ruminococcus sp.]|uniref:citrate/2-methylcitrate synthase n=1 Tax=Ruminococcus sp. TaxID=41978 RepID=UPI002873417E|nr:citrate/2-methylcitrate synthase [Ruminococcus sp.]MBQ3285897.1 citrate/2-methylcitrate synthase [Ruminococcus sp.]
MAPIHTNDQRIQELANCCIERDPIDKALYTKNNVNIGLRDLNGRGVLTGLTDISEIRQNKIVDGVPVPTDGKLFYRGINIEDIIAGCIRDKRLGFEEVVYLLLFGKLPDKQELDDFMVLLSDSRVLPKHFVRDVILKASGKDMMTALAKAVLTLASYDHDVMNLSIDNVLRQCLKLISLFPLLTVYSYQAYNHYTNGESLFIHNPERCEPTAELLLRTLREDRQFTALEAQVLDMALMLHAEHGGGNNSTFTTCVVTSSGTDTYSAIAAALCSLKGPKHGGANLRVMGMMNEIMYNVKDWTDEDEISAYLNKILNKEAYDRSGLIYGIGHAVYSISDPRARVFKGFVEKLAEEKGTTDEYDLYSRIERLAPQIIAQHRKMYKGVSANVDFYSGFVYKMMGLPQELYTPIFAVARIAGWSAHRIEELVNVNKIIRPAYMSVCQEKPYVNLEDR